MSCFPLLISTSFRTWQNVVTLCWTESWAQKCKHRLTCCMPQIIKVKLDTLVWDMSHVRHMSCIKQIHNNSVHATWVLIESEWHLYHDFFYFSSLFFTLFSSSLLCLLISNTLIACTISLLAILNLVLVTLLLVSFLTFHFRPLDYCILALR